MTESDDVTEEMTDLFQEVLEILDTPTPSPGQNEIDPQATIEQIEAVLKDVSEKAEQIYRSTGMSKEEVAEFAQDPTNFSEDEWGLISRIRDKVKEIEEETDRIAEEGFQLQNKPKKKIPSSKKGKRVKKKHWVSS